MLVPQLKELSTITPISANWILEALDEKFDDAISLLPDSCMIYGGAVRDLLANIPIGGDLDIVIPYNKYDKLRRIFNTSVRWIRKKEEQHNILSYKEIRSDIINNVSTYTNFTGDVIQLIQALPNSKNVIIVDQYKFNLGVLNIITKTDIRCSAVMTDIYGNTFEVIKDALMDCKNKTLYLNTELDNKDINKQAILKRIQKLKARGWINKIDIEALEDTKKSINLQKPRK